MQRPTAPCSLAWTLTWTFYSWAATASLTLPWRRLEIHRCFSMWCALTEYTSTHAYTVYFIYRDRHTQIMYITCNYSSHPLTRLCFLWSVQVFLQLTQDDTEPAEDKPYSVSESMPDLSASRDSLPEDLQNNSIFGDKASESRPLHCFLTSWTRLTSYYSGTLPRRKNSGP